jgi:hypothetical protein
MDGLMDRYSRYSGSGWMENCSEFNPKCDLSPPNTQTYVYVVEYPENPLKSYSGFVDRYRRPSGGFRNRIVKY